MAIYDCFQFFDEEHILDLRLNILYESVDFFVFVGGVAELEAIWAFGDAALGIMTFPNLISIVLLTGALKGMTKEYFSESHVPHQKG